MNEGPENLKTGTGPATPDVATEGLPLVKLGDLGPDTLIDEAHLAALFGKCRMSVKRSVQRGELPEPVRMFGQPTWTAGAILDHVSKRLDAAQREAEKTAAKFLKFST